MEYVAGEILTDSGFKKGHIGFEKNLIVESGKCNPPTKPICTGLIVPTFVNAHTHIGDSFIKEKNLKLPKNIEELVAPPYGLKHKMLQRAPDGDIIRGMEKSINIMIENGISYFCDFRESGILGISQLKTALRSSNIKPLILSRPDSLKYDKDEVDILLSNSDGIAISSISDWDYSELEKIVKDTRRKKKIFALHASERIREDIDKILDLKPSLLVHMIKALESDLIRVKENNIPIVICPRANSFFNLKPNFTLLKKVGVNLSIGTDNVMLNSPNILDEIHYIKSISSVYSTFELLYLTTYGARKDLNLDCKYLAPNTRAEFVVLDGKKLKPLYISV